MQIFHIVSQQAHYLLNLLPLSVEIFLFELYYDHTFSSNFLQNNRTSNELYLPALHHENLVYFLLKFRIKQTEILLKLILLHQQQKSSNFFHHFPKVSYLRSCLPYAQLLLGYLRELVLLKLEHLIQFWKSKLLQPEPTLKIHVVQQYAQSWQYYKNQKDIKSIICLKQQKLLVMHSASSRFNSITLYAGLIMALMCFINYYHGRIIYNPQADIKLQITQLPSFIRTNNWEQASFRYNMHANLSSLYTWNLKQLFVYIEVQFTDPVSKLNSRMIVSDWILNKTEDRDQIKNTFVIQVQDKPLEYSVRDVHNGLKGNILKISLNVEYMPVVGLFSKTKLYELNYTLPQKYTNQN